MGNVQFRRSLYFVQDIDAGEIITAEHVKSIRPGFGIEPKYLDLLIGRRVKQSVRKGQAVTKQIFDQTW
ncbi:SAF domain-containing protein [Thiomicrorhabdus immobilis]|uniref:SAF domain-containing protein n=1 Tax=Thiomicrorhabdus immobilis TaxID=2791037 RepID=UPI002102789D|nr:SAF domain-containing protein [Thiomicrorhabdus immobilis]